MLDEAAGHTEDISVSGIYATLLDRTAQFRLGASVRLEMQFSHGNPDGPLKVACEGQVVRVDHHDQQVSVAASITSYQFGAAAPSLLPGDRTRCHQSERGRSRRRRGLTRFTTGQPGTIHT